MKNSLNIFSLLYIILWAALFAVEIVAATTSFRAFDTMSENWWWIQGKYPWTASIGMTVVLGVLWYHLVLSKGVVK